MLEIKEETYPVKINGEVYQLSSPKVGEVKKFKSMDLQSEEAEMATENMVMGMGIPRDVYEKLSVSSVKRIIEYVSNPEKK